MEDWVIKIEHLSVSYTPTTPVLTDINLVVPRGDYLGIMGPNGGGKSTLLKAILGLVSIQEGRILLAQGVTIGYVPQFSSMERRFPITALEVVLCAFLKGGSHPFFKFSKEQKEKARGYLEQVGLGELWNRQIGQLSGGECQKLLIARALALEPSLLLLDEPTASIDAKSREHIYELLAGLAGKLTILLITHDNLAISSHVKHIACLNERLFYHGDSELSEATMHELYGCPVDLISHGVLHRGCDCNSEEGGDVEEKGGQK